MIALILPAMLLAQTLSTEDFEDETLGATSFTSNGQVFNITSQSSVFAVNHFATAYGWNGTAADHNFIDNNHSDPGVNIKFTISSNGAVPFNLKSMWLYYANSTLLPGNGTITITGLREGATVFTATESLSTPTASTSNFYTKFDMTGYGGADNSSTTIDAFSISTTGDFEYVGLDALTWATVDIATPVHLLNFNGLLQKNAAHLIWQTGVENGFDHFEVQKSVGTGKYSTIESISAKGSNSNYGFSVLQAEASANYRLKMVDKLGDISYSRQITLSGSGGEGSVIYPNPASDYINVKVAEKTAVVIYDAAGRQVKTVQLQAGINAVDITGLSKGIYYVKVANEKVSFVKK